MNNLSLISGYQSSSDSESNEEADKQPSGQQSTGMLAGLSSILPPPKKTPANVNSKPVTSKKEIEITSSDSFFTIDQPEVKAVPDETAEESTESLVYDPTSGYYYDRSTSVYYYYDPDSNSYLDASTLQPQDGIVEISQSAQLQNPPELEAMGKRTISIDNTMARAKKHKNNIMYLAAQAKTQGPKLQEAHAQRKQARRAARAKYGY